MDDITIFCAGSSQAARYACDILSSKGINTVREPCDAAKCVLFDIPSLGPGDTLRGGTDLAVVLNAVPENVILMGGGLDHPMLEKYRKYDLLKSEGYLKENARITAYCALHIIGEALPVTLEDCPVLVIGWGRIGKVLTSLLVRVGAQVTVSTRDIRSAASLAKLGISAVLTSDITPKHYRLIVNTAPLHVLDDEAVDLCKEAIKIDLASEKGLPGEDVIWAKGLPGRCAPESSGKLIAKTFLRLWKESEA